MPKIILTVSQEMLNYIEEKRNKLMLKTHQEAIRWIISNFKEREEET